MLTRPPLPNSPLTRLRHYGYAYGGEVVRWTRDRIAAIGAIGPGSPTAARFGSFGMGSIICYPAATIVNPEHIWIGEGTMIAPHVTLSTGWGPGHQGLPEKVIELGDGCLIGRGSSIVGHKSIKIGDNVWTGHGVHITDMNHGYEDLDIPIAAQAMPETPISIGAGSWLGHEVVVLPGVTIGRHVTVGAGSIVNSDLPDNCVAVGSPARVVRLHTPELGWHSVGRDGKPRG